MQDHRTETHKPSLLLRWTSKLPAPSSPLLTLAPDQKDLLSRILENDNFDNRHRLRRAAIRHRALFTPKFDISLKEQREIAQRRLSVICNEKVLSVRDFDNNPENVFSVHECVAMLDPSLATKLTVQFNLFGGTVLRLGSDRHHTLLDAVDSLDQVGCFALTELGYGNNALEMETTAIYDPHTEEFILNTPTTLSQKYWITNGANYAHWAVVFAQLLLDGESQGPHPFLVRIRNTTSMSVCDGVTIEDMGMKMGCNGVDNAKLFFTNVRVPRTALLDQMSQVSRSGDFTSKVEGRRQRFLTVADQLLSGRLCIASMMLGGCKVVLTTTMRYSATRCGVGKTGLSDCPILTYQLQTDALVPLLAKTIVCNIFLSHVKQKYSLLHKKIPPTGDINTAPRPSSLAFEVMLLCCAIKPFLAWHSERVATICRERVGGQGYLSINLIGEYLTGAHAGMTVEGDSRVLWQKVAKELLTAAQEKDATTATGWKTVEGFSSKYAAKGSFPSFAFISDVLEIRERRRLDILRKKLEKEVSSLIQTSDMKSALFISWMKSSSPEVMSLAAAFTERRAFEAVITTLLEQFTSEDSSACRQVIEYCLLLFSLECLKQDAAWFGSEHLLSPRELGLLESLLGEVTKSLSDGTLLLQLVNCFNIPEELLFAPIAHDKWSETLG